MTDTKKASPIPTASATMAITPSSTTPAMATSTTIIEHPPHVHRLLRLIREGTPSHASSASILLARYAAAATADSSSSCIAIANANANADDVVKEEAANNNNNNNNNDNNNINKKKNPPPFNSATIIWDLIGQLVEGDGGNYRNGRNNYNNYNTKSTSSNSSNSSSGLFDPNWSTRQNCAVALESVAKCLPLEDRRHFFEGGYCDNDDDDNDNDDDDEDGDCEDNHHGNYRAVGAAKEKDNNQAKRNKNNETVSRQNKEKEALLLWLNVKDLQSSVKLEEGDASATTTIKSTISTATEASNNATSNNAAIKSTTTQTTPNQLEIVIQRGRPLLSSSGEKYNWRSYYYADNNDDNNYDNGDGGTVAGDSNDNKNAMEYSREKEALQQLDATAHVAVVGVGVNGKHANNMEKNDKDYNMNPSSSSSSLAVAAACTTPTTANTTMQKSFLMKRIMLQRQILARRLGLEGILSAPIVVNAREDVEFEKDEEEEGMVPEAVVSSNNGESSNSQSKPALTLSSASSSSRRRHRRIIDDIVKDEDFLSEYIESPPPNARDKQQRTQDERMERFKKRRRLEAAASSSAAASMTNSGTNPGPDVSIRALLVLEIERPSSPTAATVASTMDGGTLLSKRNTHARHRNPQTLLGSELAYRTFDPEWTVRHGALLGTLALLRAWRVHDSSYYETIMPMEDGDGDKNHGGSSNQTPYAARRKCKKRFGKWPHDILARCVCILALDRFADFSGTAICKMTRSSNHTHNNNNNSMDKDNGENTMSDLSSGAIVTPVREMAAQIMAILLEAAPSNVWHSTHSLLMQLYTRQKNHTNDNHPSGIGGGWEIRHGVLLAWKYVCAMSLIHSSKKGRLLSPPMANNNADKSCSLPTEQRQQSDQSHYCCTYDNILLQSIQGLEDSSDDVRATAAQVLLHFLRVDTSLYTVDIIKKCSNPLWNAILMIRGDVSSCATDLLSLFADVLSRDCTTVLGCLHDTFKRGEQTMLWAPSLDKVLHKLADFINYDSIHVKMSCFHALGLTAEPITRSVLNTFSTDEEAVGSTEKRMQHVYDLTCTLCELLKRLFETHFSIGYIIDDGNSGGKNSQNKVYQVEHSENKAVIRVRHQAWSKILDALGYVGKFDAMKSTRFSRKIINKIVVELTLRYFYISSDNMNDGELATEISFSSKLTSAKALSQFFKKVKSISDESSKEISCFLSLTILFILQSPWFSQCEAGCLLLNQTVITSANGILDNEHVNSYNNHCEGSGAIDTHFFEYCIPSLLDALSVTPICILAEGNDFARKVLNDRSVKSLCNNGLATLLDSFMDFSNREQQKRTHKDMICIWERLLTEKGLSFEVLRKSSIQALNKTSMRLSTTNSGAIVSCGSMYLPPKITPIIRSLMTSLKNEESGKRSTEVSRYISRLVSILSDNPNHEKTRIAARDKLIKNLCNLACKESSEYLSEASSSCSGAKHTIELIIYSVSSKCKIQDFPPIWEYLSILLNGFPSILSEPRLADSICILSIVSKSLPGDSPSFQCILDSFLKVVTGVACRSEANRLRTMASETTLNLCKINIAASMKIIIPTILPILDNLEDDPARQWGCELLLTVLQELRVLASPYVITLLPVAMRLMTDSMEECSRLAASAFAILVRIAPLAASYFNTDDGKPHSTVGCIGVRKNQKESSENVVRHLILGKPLPPSELSDAILSELLKSGTILRPYQMEGITWMNFLRDVRLNGALCDDMGLGKTLQSLIVVAISHSSDSSENVSLQTSNPRNNKKSLVICPSSVVGHWLNEIKRFFPSEKVLTPFDFTGTARRGSWDEHIENCNIIVTSYSVLRSDIDLLDDMVWNYCILDEGHLLKNPSTATAKASRRLKARHKLILTGTPIQNNVQEIWATFDFLMPNFLGSEPHFRKEFARPISKSQAPDASADDIGLGTDSLKILHQQVLPFVLRREKSQVIKELPPKIVTDVPCTLSTQQHALYQRMLKQSRTKIALDAVRSSLGYHEGVSADDGRHTGNDILASLLQLRLICTHPILHILFSSKGNIRNISDICRSYYHLGSSGKLLALNDILRHAGIAEAEMTAADNDTSAYEVDVNEDISNNNIHDYLGDEIAHSTNHSSKCLIFAQFTQSLDVVEKFLFEPHMPLLQYLRLDGRVPTSQRSSIVDRFNQDCNIKVLLLTTKVGGLGLNLTGADKVIFLEPDWNPFVDLQAMDRAHRIGQTKTVNVYRLITANSIEEEMMEVQHRKKATSEAIVNADNSTMFSMGTDRLLDIFTFSGCSSTAPTPLPTQRDGDNVLSYLEDGESDEYAGLSVGSFMGGFEGS